MNTDFIQTIDDDNLPHQWRNVIIEENGIPEKHETYVRSSISDIVACDKWVKEFSRLTSTQWKMRNSYPHSSYKRVCKKVYVCHHSSFQKEVTDEQNKNKRGISKNTKCLAQLTLVVKVTTTFSKRRDRFTKDGMPGVIRLRTCHNHPLNSPSILRYLSPSADVREEFYKYFQMGMSVSSACQFHKNKIIFEHHDSQLDDMDIDDENILFNARLNPTRRTVQHWFSCWRKNEFKDNSDSIEKLDEKVSVCPSSIETVELDEPFILIKEITEDDSRISEVSVISSPCGSVETKMISDIAIPSRDQNEIHAEKESESGFKFENVIFTMETLHETFGGTSLENLALSKFRKRLIKIKTSREWLSFLQTASKNVPLRRKVGAKVNVQPTKMTAIERRRRKLRAHRAVILKRSARKKIPKRSTQETSNLSMNFPIILI